MASRIKLDDYQKAAILTDVERFLDQVCLSVGCDNSEGGPTGSGLGEEIYNLLIQKLEK